MKGTPRGLSEEAGTYYVGTLQGPLYAWTPDATGSNRDPLSWLAGTWRGEMGEAAIEETWSEREGDNRMGMFRMVASGTVGAAWKLRYTRQTMSLAIKAEPLPIVTDADGVARVGGTRVTLDTVVMAYTEGLSAEEIVRQYPSLDLADAHAAIAYYLRHRGEVDAYLEERRELADAVRRENEARCDPDPATFRERLLARRRS